MCLLFSKIKTHLAPTYQETRLGKVEQNAGQPKERRPGLLPSIVVDTRVPATWVSRTLSGSSASDRKMSPQVDDCVKRLKALGLAPRDHPQHAMLPRASVLVLLFEGRDNKGTCTLHTLITKRSLKLKSHPGECCFPGGRQDEEDDGDDIRTALREAQEEVGIDPSRAAVLGRLHTAESLNHLCVTPVIAFIDSKEDLLKSYPWRINQDEVDDVFSVPLSYFLRGPESIFEILCSWVFSMRAYVYRDTESKKSFSITGLTAHIAHEAAVVAYGRP